MSQIKDTDYLGISTRVRAMENRLLTAERMERMLDAKTDEDAVKVLAECGYEDFSGSDLESLGAALARARGQVFRDLRAAAPDPTLLDVFQIKYDYHNAKVLLKAEAMGVEAYRLLQSGGRYAEDGLREGFLRGELPECSDTYRRAVEEAKEALHAGDDPQTADFVLDRACYEEMTAAAQATGSEFLKGYVKLTIDAANLRAVVRGARMGKGSDFLAGVLAQGGSVDPHTLLTVKPEDVGEVFRAGLLAEAAQAGSALAVPGGGSLTEFERLCDNALIAYLAQAKRVSFGAPVVVAYLCARESELTAIRIILAGRRAGLAPDIIRERLRDTYV